MMLKGGEGLRHDGVAAVRIFEHGAEVVEECRALRIARVAVGVEFDGIATAFEIPASKVEEVNRLLQHPRTDAALIVAPAARSRAVRFAQQFDEHVLRIADGACINDFLDTAPLRRKAQLMPDGEMHAVIACAGHDGFAIVERDGHRLLQKNVFALLHRREGDLAMRVTRRGDVDDVEVSLRDHFEAVSEDLGLGIEFASLLTRGL